MWNITALLHYHDEKKVILHMFMFVWSLLLFPKGVYVIWLSRINLSESSEISKVALLVLSFLILFFD